jgi:hypothetical protein
MKTTKVFFSQSITANNPNWKENLKRFFPWVTKTVLKMIDINSHRGKPTVASNYIAIGETNAYPYPKSEEEFLREFPSDNENKSIIWNPDAPDETP